MRSFQLLAACGWLSQPDKRLVQRIPFDDITVTVVSPRTLYRMKRNMPGDQEQPREPPPPNLTLSRA